ncbi:PREDICTED: uncharacterized protein LOC106121559, partial [Papilio xuthus]|uniref:Uncharacterized protein LOC106121559 n=1 Tax=Papilio xuthus TaxID=66420 RepID=A0AAJ6ZHJ6_PAPXU
MSRKLTFAMIQEPYIGSIGEVKQYPGTRVIQYTRTPNSDKVIKSAIILFDNTINITQYPNLTTENIAVVKLRTRSWEIGVISIYLEGDKPIEPYLEGIKRAVDNIDTQNILLGGDVNAWNTWWGSRFTNSRGEDMAALLDQLELHLLNTGSESTFDAVRGDKRFSSCVDITTCSTTLLDKIDNWRTDSSIINSDHKALTFTINLEKSIGTDIERTTRKYNTRKANWNEFKEKLEANLKKNNVNKQEIEQTTTPQQLDTIVQNYTNSIQNACDDCFKKEPKNRKIKLTWWTEALTKKKKEVLTKKRRIACAAPIRRRKVVEEYLKAKEEYEKEIKEAQTSSWKSFCTKQDKESMWDSIYRVINRTTKRQEELPITENGQTLNGVESAK